MSPIHVNYDNVFRQAARLRRIGEEHRSAAQTLEHQRDQLSASWRDPAGATYAQAATHLAAEMRTSADELIRLAGLIERAAREYKQQEEANAAAAGGLAT